MGNSQFAASEKDAVDESNMQICPADSELMRGGGDAEARADPARINGMISRMVDLPMGIGRTTYTLCLYRSSRANGVRQQTLDGLLSCGSSGEGHQGQTVAETGQEVLYRR
jgi:hypothetical protein